MGAEPKVELSWCCRPPFEDAQSGERRLVYSNRCGRVRLHNVSVVNRGLDFDHPSNTFWAHKVGSANCKVALRLTAMPAMGGLTLLPALGAVCSAPYSCCFVCRCTGRRRPASSSMASPSLRHPTSFCTATTCSRCAWGAASCPECCFCPEAARALCKHAPVGQLLLKQACQQRNWPAAEAAAAQKQACTQHVQPMGRCCSLARSQCWLAVCQGQAEMQACAAEGYRWH